MRLREAISLRFAWLIFLMTAEGGSAFRECMTRKKYASSNSQMFSDFTLAKVLYDAHIRHRLE